MTASCARPGSAPRRTTRRATTCGGAGTTRGWRPSTGIRSSIRVPARTRPTSSAASTSCCCRSPASRIRRAARPLRAFWRDTLAQPDPGDLAGECASALSVPFVDYARGDGRRSGPGGDVDWTPILDRRRGRLGRSISGAVGARHRRPVRRRTRAGRTQVHPDRLRPPVVVRPARVRRSRQGGAAVAAVAVLETRLAELTARRGPGPLRRPTPLAVSPARARRGARRACARRPAWSGYRDGRAAELRTRRGATGRHPRRDRRAGHRHRSRPRPACRAPGRPVLDDPRLHLHHASEPEPPAVTRRRAFGEAWAALSVGLLIAALAVIVWFRILPPRDRDRRAVRLVPRDRVVLRSQHHGVSCSGSRVVPGDHLGGHPGRRIPARAVARRPARHSASSCLRQPRRGPPPRLPLTERSAARSARSMAHQIPDPRPPPVRPPRGDPWPSTTAPAP